MTIDTIYGLNRFLAFLGNCATAIETSINNRSVEIEWRRERQRTRKQLLKLSEHQLRDIGISREEAEAEARRDFWDGVAETRVRTKLR